MPKATHGENPAKRLGNIDFFPDGIAGLISSIDPIECELSGLSQSSDNCLGNNPSMIDDNRHFIAHANTGKGGIQHETT